MSISADLMTARRENPKPNIYANSQATSKKADTLNKQRNIFDPNEAIVKVNKNKKPKSQPIKSQKKDVKFKIDPNKVSDGNTPPVPFALALPPFANLDVPGMRATRRMRYGEISVSPIK